jgi:hypothetical protein
VPDKEKQAASPTMMGHLDLYDLFAVVIFGVLENGS